MAVIHFGPTRLTIDSWDDLLAAAEGGLLNEQTYCELKKGLPPPGNNTEVARDLASFGVMGGMFVVGVADAGNGKAGEVVGVSDAHATKARLVGVAEGVVQPSLACEVHIVENPDGSGVGCVVVEIFPSPSAPHRADERYWGRSAEGKRILADPEIEFLFARRRQSQNEFVSRLHRLEEELDPIEDDDSPNGRFSFLAQPMQTVFPAPDWQGRNILDLVTDADLPRGSHGWPDLSGLNYATRHPRGIAAQSFEPGKPAFGSGYGYYNQRMVVEDDGSTSYVAHLASFPDEDKVTRVPTAALYERIDHCVRFAAAVAEATGIGGQWQLGIRMTRLRGAQRLEASKLRYGYPVYFADPEYVKTAEASGGDIRDRPEVVTEALAKGLARGFGEDHLFPYTDPASFFAARP